MSERLAHDGFCILPNAEPSAVEASVAEDEEEEEEEEATTQNTTVGLGILHVSGENDTQYYRLGSEVTTNQDCRLEVPRQTSTAAPHVLLSPSPALR